MAAAAVVTDSSMLCHVTAYQKRWREPIAAHAQFCHDHLIIAQHVTPPCNAVLFTIEHDGVEYTWPTDLFVETPTGLPFLLNAAILLDRVSIAACFVRDYRDLLTPSAMDCAARFGRLAIVQLLAAVGGTCTHKAMDAAAKHGHLDVVAYLHERCNACCTVDAMDWAAASGHLDIVKFLHFHRSEGCTESAMDSAANGNHWPVLEFLGTYRAEGFSVQAYYSAAENGAVRVLQFLEAHDPVGLRYWNTAFCRAASRGHINVVKYLLHGEDRWWNLRRAMESAVECCQLDMVKFLWPKCVAAGIAPTGLLEEIRFLRQPESVALQLVLYLHGRGASGSTKAMDRAATGGHLDVVKFLHFNCDEGARPKPWMALPLTAIYTSSSSFMRFAPRATRRRLFTTRLSMATLSSFWRAIDAKATRA